MKKLFSFLAMMLIAICAQAQATQVGLFDFSKAYADGDAISSSSAKLTLGNDMKQWKTSATKISETGALYAFGQNVTVKNDDGEDVEQFSAITLTGSNNPKDLAESGKGSGINCAEGMNTANLPLNGCYYIFEPQADGKVQLGIILNLDKAFYLIDATNATFDGTHLSVALPEANLHNYVIKDKDGNEVALADDKDGKGGKITAEKITGTLEFDAVAGKKYYFFCAGSKLGCFGYLFTPNAVEPSVVAPTFAPLSGETVEYGSNVEISYEDGLLLYYTTDGSDPESPLSDVKSAFTNPEQVTVDQEGSFTIKAFVENPANEQRSQVVTATYTVTGGPVVVGAPTFNPEPGPVPAGTWVTILPGENGQSVTFTSDGKDPAVYGDVAPKGRVLINEETTIRAYSQDADGHKSEEVRAVYTIAAPVIVPEVTFDPVAGTEVEVGDEIAINFDGDNFQAYVTTDGSDPATSLTMMNLFPGETVTVAGEGEFTVKVVLENNQTPATSLTMMNLFPGETVTVAGEGEFTVKVVLENNQTNEQTPFEAVYPIKPVAEPWVTFDPVAGTEVAVDDEITIDFDGDNFQAWVTTDGSDPAVSATAANWFPGEAVVVTGEGELTVKVVLERNGSTSTQEPLYAFEAVYPIKVADVVIETKANGLGTFCYDKDLDFSASDVHAYVARVSGNNVFLTEVTEVPAFTGVLVKGENGAEEVTVPVMEGAAPIAAANDFVGVIEDTEVEAGTCSVLSLLDGEEGFYKFLGTVIPANKAYFTTVANNANAKLTLIFDDVDGIKALISDAIVEGKAYNLNGQRVYDSYKGIVIINGKKYVKK